MIDTEGLTSVLRDLNAERHGEVGPADGGARATTVVAVRQETGERLVEAIFHASHRLAVYGSFAPGRENYGVIAHLRGSWSSGYVEGDLYPSGWGAAHGFPGMRWTPGGARIPVELLTSTDLPEAWLALDEFEGVDYRRSLVPVYDGEQVVAVANIYECRRIMVRSEAGAPG